MCFRPRGTGVYDSGRARLLGIRKINDIYTHRVSSFMYKYNTNMLPTNFINYFTKSSAVRVHNTRSADNFHLVFSHSTLRLNSVRHAGPRIWNNLPHDLKVACSLSVFIRKMKSLLDFIVLWCVHCLHCFFNLIKKAI